jgi:type IV pilus assembly protein PilC
VLNLPRRRWLRNGGLNLEVGYNANSLYFSGSAMFSPRVKTSELAPLCRRLATGLEAGIDVRKVWSREVEGRASASLRSRLSEVRDAVAAGRSVTDGLEQTGDYFPPLFREMVHVGEQTGKLAEVFRQLAEHYDHQLSLRRTFLASITWPMFQLAAAVGVIGLLIWVLGILPPGADGKPIDILGFGLVGTTGLAIYLLNVAALALGIYLLVTALRRGVAWTRPIQRLALLLPWLGTCLQTLALSRLAWVMHVTMETGMDLRHILALSLGSTHNARYTDYSEQVIAEVVRGREIHEAFAGTGVFPRDFLDTLEVGERSGRLPESMAILSRQYQEQAKRALATLTVLAGFAVWGLVALLIIAMIFRLAMFYIGAINDAANMSL